MFAIFFSGNVQAEPFQSPAEAPATWTAFAKTLQVQCEAVLRADDEIAHRLQAALETLRRANSDLPPLTLMVRVWIASSGRVERVAFTSLSDPAADADLRALLTRVAVSAPPAGMLQPVHLGLSLEPRK